MVSTDREIKNVLLPLISEAIKKAVRSNKVNALDLPYLGDEVYEIMAESALNVLLGMADAERYMEREGLIEH